MNRKTDPRFFGMLGFAMRAGKVAVGTDLVISAMRAKGKNAARLVLVSSDASEQTKKRLRFKAEFYKIRFFEADTTADELGGALGKSFSPVALAILDDRFAEEIVKAMSDTHPTDKERDITTQRKEVSDLGNR